MINDKFDELDNIEFERTLEEEILENSKPFTKKFNGLFPLTLDKYRIKKVTCPLTEENVLVSLIGEDNYYICAKKEFRRKTNNKVFGFDLVKKEEKDLYICESFMDSLILNQELGLQAVSIYNDIEEIINSYEILDDKNLYFISSSNVFDDIINKLNLSNKSKLIKLDSSINDHFKLNKDILLINDYLLGAKSPSGIKTADIDSLSKGDLVSKKKFGYSSGFKNVDKQTQGFYCDLIGTGSGTGCGKTTMQLQFAANLIKQGVKVGLMLLEQADETETLLSLAGHFDNMNYNYMFGSEKQESDFEYEFDEIEDSSTQDEDEDIINLTSDDKIDLTENYLKPTLQKIKDNVEIMTNDNEIQGVEDALRAIRSLIIQKGCRAIFLDHTTYLTDGVENQNKAVQELMQGLMQIKNRHNVNIFYVTHLRKSKSSNETHEEGARVRMDDFAGGKAATQYATVVLGMERDMHNEDLELASITKVRLLKRRGMAVKPGSSVTEMKYDLMTNKIYPKNCIKPTNSFKDIPF